MKEIFSNGIPLGYSDSRDEFLWTASLLSNFFYKGSYYVSLPHDNIAILTLFVFLASVSEIHAIASEDQLVTLRNLLNKLIDLLGDLASFKGSLRGIRAISKEGDILAEPSAWVHRCSHNTIFPFTGL